MSVLTPVRVDELLPAVKSLVDVASIQTALGGTGRVYVAQGDSLLSDEEFPSIDANGMAGRIVLMTRNDSPREYLDMTVPVYWNLRIDMIKGQSDANIFLNYVQELCYGLLQDKTVSLTSSDVLFKIWRQNLSQQVRRDEEGWFYLSAIYQTILTPK